MSEKQELLDHIHHFIKRGASPPPVVLESWMDQIEDLVYTLKHLRWALQAAGQLAIKAEFVLQCSSFDLSSAVEQLHDALNEYNERILSIHEAEREEKNHE
jgi:hypothetical protein